MDSESARFYLFIYFFFSESYVKLLISIKYLEKEKRKVIEEILTKEVQNYLKFHDHSGDSHARAMKSFTEHLINVYWVHLVTVDGGSVIIILECLTLDSLEHLWRDYLAGDLDKFADRYLVTDQMKEKLKLKANILKTTIEEQNYLICKKALVELRSTYPGEFKRNVGKAQLFTCRCSSFVLLCKNNDYNIIIITMTLITMIIILIGILYTSKDALHY